MTASSLQVISRTLLLDPALNPIYILLVESVSYPWAPICKMSMYTLLRDGILLPRITPITQYSDIQRDVNFCFNRLSLSNVHVHKIFKHHFHCAGAAGKQKACTQRISPCPQPITAD